MFILSLDETGRILIPQKLRQQLGLKGKEQLLGDIQDGKLILQPVTEQTKIIEENGLLVVESESINNLENIIEQLREEHLDQFLSR